MDTLNKHLYGIKENIKVLNYALYAFTYRKDETGELSVWDEMIKNLLEEHISNVEEKVDAIQTQIEIIKEQYKESKKGEWRMPWLSEAMKDVISCDKLWGGANDL